MAIFQSSVLKKYLKQLDTETVAKLYKKYTKYFHDPAIQQNIRESKEEQYQAKFLDELFVNVLGYTMNPQPNFNLTTEFKNVKNSRKADGAILDKDEAVAVIELKGTKTKDLESIRQQAFDYKANQPGCVYVITSNFEKLRFYINNAVDFEEFDLFMLSYERFEMLYLCLHKNNLLQHLPLKIKEASLHEEEAITKKFYSDYSNFKRELFRDMVKRNLRNPALKELGESSSKKELFKKTQKLLDRFLFIFFGEDRGLLPPNSIPKILEQWESLKKMDAYSPLYERYKKYFGYLNEGWKGQDHEIFAYNGGLFKPDPILDTIEIDDELLFKHTSILTKYDFESQVDVNILGHIFEHSLNEIESVNAEIDGVEFDKQKTKRKKDGVFYTPKYITKYIVDNTVGKLCEEKKAELDIREEEYLKGPKNRAKTTIQKLDEQLEAYRAWLLTLTICDPACGSGAFLNQALDFLILEHRWIDEMSSKLHGGGFVFPDIENSILEKNIYGVDLNDESVEIAKLSLWLRTAQKGRKLTSLNSNIKCGNSLIDSKAVAGDKAFSWSTEFPEVFAKGGFDVVIGNPPYVNINTLPHEIHEYFKKNYSTIHTGYNDLMYYFLYKGINLLKKEGVFGVITSNYFIGNEYAKSLRGFLSKHVSEILNFDDYLIFQDANVHTAIIFAEKQQKNQIVKYSNLKNSKEILLSIESNSFETMSKDRELLEEYWVFASNEKNQIIEKINIKGKLLGQIAEIEKGSTSGKNDVFTVSKETIVKYDLESEILRKNVKNGDIQKYKINDRETFLIYTDNDTEIEKYPNVLNYFNEHKETLSNRNEVKKGSYDWWRMERPRRKEIYDAKEKIIVPYRAVNNRFAYDNERRFNDGGDIRVLLITDENIQIKYVLGILNSKLIDWYYGFIGKPKGNAREYFNEPLAKIPVFLADNDIQTKITQLVDLITLRLENAQNINNKFINYLQSQFSLEKLSNKLQSWYTLDFSDFIKELNKAIKKAGGNQLSKLDEMEWMELFETKKKEALELKAEIDRTDREIDGMVYELYGLTDEEVQIVEQS